MSEVTQPYIPPQVVHSHPEVPGIKIGIILSVDGCQMVLASGELHLPQGAEAARQLVAKFVAAHAEIKQAIKNALGDLPHEARISTVQSWVGVLG